jgi:hypothetical protein
MSFTLGVAVSYASQRRRTRTEQRSWQTRAMPLIVRHTPVSFTVRMILDSFPIYTGQSWQMSGGSLQIFGNKCLDVTNGSTQNGNTMHIWTCVTGNANQQFSITDDARITWKSECLI